MVLVLLLLSATIGLFVSELVRIDIAAILVMVAIGLLGLVPARDLFNGFASNAVISIIAVMILGAGLDRTGAMTVVSRWILKVGGNTVARIVPLVSGTVGLISGVMQNVGATALFLPVMSRISARTEIPLSRLLMPMGTCAILGGTLTMVGSSPLILLNDLIENANQTLPPGVETLETFHLFDVTPVGIVMLATGILYFLIAGKWLLPAPAEKPSGGAPSKTKTYFADIYGIEGDIYELLVTVDSPLVGMTIADAEQMEGAPLMLAIRNTDEPRLAPPADEMIWVGTILGVMGTREVVGRFALDNECRVQPRLRTFGAVTSDAALARELAEMYPHPDDIDVWVGGLAEDHVPGAMVGPLFRAILADQFRRLRDGDPNWYETLYSGSRRDETERGRSSSARAAATASSWSGRA